jgi:hypothetical protein
MVNRDQNRNSLTGWFYSLAFHSVLTVILLAITVDMSPIVPEFAEMTITRLAAAENRVVTENRTVRAAVPPPPAPAQGVNTRLVDLPKRRMTDLERETIPLEVLDKVRAEELQSVRAAEIDPLRGIYREPGTGTVPVIAERRQPESGNIDLGKKIVSPVSSEGIVGDMQFSIPYEIAWEGGIRDVLAEKLPSFPENIAKEVALTFRMEVLPDGSVREITTLKKGEATLESVTRQALRQWLFNPLDRNAPQESQFGTITFRFVLQ